MSEVSPQITNALLRVSVDPGHGGPFLEYRIDADQEGSQVTLRISKVLPASERTPIASPRPPSPVSRPLPASEENYRSTSQLTEVLVKESQQVEEFLSKLSAEFDVFALVDLKPSYPFLHPTFYSFSFQNAAGETHHFEYKIECTNHLDEKYKGLIEEFDCFFESERVWRKFLESQ